MFAAIGSKLVIYVLGALAILGLVGGVTYQYHFKPLNIIKKENKLLKENTEKLINEKNTLLLKINNSEALLAECKDSLKAVAFESKWTHKSKDLNKEINNFNKKGTNPNKVIKNGKNTNPSYFVF